MPAPILHWDLWPTVGHLVHTIATQRGFYNESKFPTTLLVYSSAIYLQGMIFRYGLGGRLACCLLYQLTAASATATTAALNATLTAAALTAILTAASPTFIHLFIATCFTCSLVSEALSSELMLLA